LNPPPPAAQKIIFALDVPTLEEARKFVKLLKDRTGFFKVGLELHTAFGKKRSGRSRTREAGFFWT